MTSNMTSSMTPRYVIAVTISRRLRLLKMNLPAVNYHVLSPPLTPPHSLAPASSAHTNDVVGDTHEMQLPKNSVYNYGLCHWLAHSSVLLPPWPRSCTIDRAAVDTTLLCEGKHNNNSMVEQYHERLEGRGYRSCRPLGDGKNRGADQSLLYSIRVYWVTSSRCTSNGSQPPPPAQQRNTATVIFTTST